MSRKTFLIATLITLGAVLLTVPLAMEYTSRPEFCAKCHEITPYVTTWRESTHKTINCFACHIQPGFSNYLARKVRGLREVYVHFSTSNPVPKAEMTSAICLSCHANGGAGSRFNNIPEAKETTNFTFSHQLHLKNSSLSDCLTCHRGVVHGFGPTAQLGLTSGSKVTGQVSGKDVPTQTAEVRGTGASGSPGTAKGALMLSVCARCHDPRPAGVTEQDPRRWPRDTSCLFCHKSMP